MHFPEAMMHEQVWFDRPKYEAERENYLLFLNNNLTLQVSKVHEEIFTEETAAVVMAAGNATSPLINEIAKARENIRQTLSGVESSSTVFSSSEVASTKAENAELKRLVKDLASQVEALTIRVTKLEGGSSSTQAQAPEKKEVADDDEFDLFGSDSEEDEEESEAARIKKEQLIAAYNAKKSKKPALIPKSSILLDVKPWDDETDMVEMEKMVRTIKLDGLVWAAQAKLVPLAYGIRKLQIGCVVEDDKVGTDILEEKITKFEELVQSVDIAAFNKI